MHEPQNFLALKTSQRLSNCGENMMEEIKLQIQGSFWSKKELPPFTKVQPMVVLGDIHKGRPSEGKGGSLAN